MNRSHDCFRMPGSPLKKATRPASHWLALGAFCIVILVSPVLWRVAKNSYIDGHYVLASRMVVALGLGIVGFSVMIVYGRNRLSYYVTSACLGCYSLLSIVSSFEFISHWSSSAHQVVATAPRIELRFTTLILSLLMILLFWRFVFGKASRCYYGLQATSSEEPRAER